MADTITDVRISTTAYWDVYALTKIAKGTDLVIQNKTSGGVYIQVRSTIPAAASRDGFLLMSNDTCVVTSVGTSSVWMIGNGAVCIQIFE